MNFRTVILDHIKKYQKFPTVTELQEISGFNAERVKQVLNNLEEEGFLDKLPETGKYTISMNYWMRPQKEEIEESLPEEICPFPIPIPEELEKADSSFVDSEKRKSFFEATPFDASVIKEAAERLKSFKGFAKRKESFDFNKIMIFALRSIMLLIGFSASVISIYYTSIWMLEFLPFGLAILLSSIMVLFSISSFEVVILFLSQQKKKHWSKIPVIISFSLLWLMVTVFSITSTIAGQYNKNTANNKDFANAHKEKTVEMVQLNDIREQKKYLLTQREEKQKQIAHLLNISTEANSLTAQEKHISTLNSISWRASQIEKQVNDFSKQLDSLTDQENSLLKKTPELASPELTSDSDFYSWLAKIFGVTKDVLQFWMSLFPAIFVDIISPASIAIAMFLKSEKVKK